MRWAPPDRAAGPQDTARASARSAAPGVSRVPAQLVLLCVLGLTECGPGERARSPQPTSDPPPEPTSASSEQTAPRSTARRVSVSAGIEVQGEVGGLDQAAVDATVQTAGSAIDACWERSTERNELVAGTIQLVLGIGSKGRSAYGYVSQSTLGDARAERCMLEALTAKSWPKPVGGKIGVVRTSLAFEAPKGARAPTPWSSAQVREVLSSAASELAACKRGSTGTFTATAYVKQIELPPPVVADDAGADAGDGGDAGPTLAGAAISVGIATSDQHAAAAVECLERVLSRAVYPAPGDWPAKVTFGF